MSLNVKLRLRRIVNRDTIYQNLMFVFCVLFGLAMIANTQSAGDGGWFWYATFLHSGKRLYSDMHLALQPLFVLETESFMALLGKGWLVSRVLAILHVVAYCVALLILVRRSDFSDGQKAVILGCGFFVPICFEAYRFDDYHVLADCFLLYSLVALLLLQKAANTRTGILLASILGILSGLALMNRLTDGAALFVGVGIAIVCLTPSRRLLSVLLFGVMAVLTAVFIVSLTGDSLHEYAMYSIFRAAGSKEGTSNVLAYPLHLPINTLRWLKRDPQYPTLIAYVLLVALSWVFLLRPLVRRRGWRELAMAAVGIVLILLPLHRMSLSIMDLDVTLVVSLSAIAVLVAYGLGLLVLIRFLRWQMLPGGAYAWDRREILLLIPLGQLASGSMSSGGTHRGLYGPVAVLIVLLSICPPIRFKAEWPRTCLIAVAVILMCSAAIFKFRDPYSWHAYREQPMFFGRTLYHHPNYGPMILDSELLKFIEPVCEQVGDGGPQKELLSLPFSYANYFCSVPPWHNYVQTFFDTSSKETILGLMDELRTSPPKWILYQRQLHTLSIHETVFNQGQPLAHRYLDQMIEQKLADRSWQAVYTSDYGDRPVWDNHWILIRTRE
jgi:hypothetical protein